MIAEESGEEGAYEATKEGACTEVANFSGVITPRLAGEDARQNDRRTNVPSM